MKKKKGASKIMGVKGAGTVVTAFIGLVIIYVAFGILNPKVFSPLEYPEPSAFHVQVPSESVSDRVLL